MVTTEDQAFLLRTARAVLEGMKEEQKVPKQLLEKRGVFVTLTIDGALRGCIGELYPVHSIYDAVVENTKRAAYDDSRFPQVTEREKPLIRIELSILSLPEAIAYTSQKQLFGLLHNHPGVIIRADDHAATFLPQVWDTLRDPEEFLSHLCAKAGLPPNRWKKGVHIELYTVEHFQER